jgi:ribonucleoside-diphosphate reductase alpha chain
MRTQEINHQLNHRVWSDQALTVLRERYLAKDPESGVVVEIPDELVRRVARCVAESERLYGGTESTTPSPGTPTPF